jgi:hypothetical protein
MEQSGRFQPVVVNAFWRFADKLNHHALTSDNFGFFLVALLAPTGRVEIF